ncbi:mitochondrial import inner membrane translocase subunit PAM16 like 2-like isoform X1 [Magnolia sinica]|uniref:mitochondrial import inner membrane translocase subunit PAM16 like 2-like isoform X1 n=1 Tax=Magnolia sinica TaxID=86752 RepID=UPI00265AD42B|nr:mitochondrial import inner membrane translocase subunit PAM16 like 2-like isoform X1 [Magnolia sinica]
MASKILANLIVMGSGILARALVQAYRQALANASKTGVAQETIQNTVHRASKIMTEQEARQILGVTEASSWEEIVKEPSKTINIFESLVAVLLFMSLHDERTTQPLKLISSSSSSFSFLNLLWRLAFPGSERL